MVTIETTENVGAASEAAVVQMLVEKHGLLGEALVHANLKLWSKHVLPRVPQTEERRCVARIRGQLEKLRHKMQQRRRAARLENNNVVKDKERALRQEVGVKRVTLENANDRALDKGQQMVNFLARNDAKTLHEEPRMSHERYNIYQTAGLTL